MHEIAAVILAAGRATRFRAASTLPTKLTALWRGMGLVRHVAEVALASQARPVIVVTGFARDAVEAALAGLPLAFVHNADFASGLAGSLKAALETVPGECAGALVMLGDMPQVRPATLDAMISAFRHRDARALVPVHNGQSGNPVLVGRTLFSEIASLSGDQGARRLLSTLQAGVIAWACDDPGILADIDTPDGLANLPD